MEILRNYSLKNLNTFRIDVKSNYFVQIEGEKDLLQLLKSKTIPSSNIMILGGGSNVLFLNNFSGLIIHNSIKGIEIIDENDDSVFIKSGTGENWDDLVKFCVERNYGGIENLSLIPGTVGAAPVQNIGAYGVELKDVLETLEGIFIENAGRKIFSKNDCRFEYRNSIFKTSLKNKFFITCITIKLKKNPVPSIEYASLKESIIRAGIKNPTIGDIRNHVIEIRRSKLPDPLSLGNAGSFFKNPLVDRDQIEKIKKEYDDLVYYDEGKGSFKISAGWLIEKCGLKGKKIGNAGTYDKQALVVVNHGNATGREIFEFSEFIRESVYNRFNIELKPEVNIIH